MRPRLRGHWQATVGGTIAVALVIVALAAPRLAPYDPAQQDLRNTLQPPFTSRHPLGTDEFGRDTLSRLIFGARVSLVAGILTAAICILIGVPLGLIAGYYRGYVDLILGRIVDAVLGIPSILLALGLAAVFGPSLRIIVASLAAVWWANYARIIRGEALALRNTPFVEAGRALGCSDARLITRYLLPNVLPLTLVLASLTVASAILVEASLSFLGVGVQPPTPSWGGMLAAGRTFIRTAWWLSTIPGVAIAATVLGLNLFGDGLRDVADPRLRR